MDLSKYFFNTNFTIAKNYKFLDGIYTTKCKEYLSQMRFVMHKLNKDDPFNEQQKDQCGNLGEKNVKTEENEIFKTELIGFEHLNQKKIDLNENFFEPHFYKYQKLDLIGKDIFLNEEQRNNLRIFLFSNYKNLAKYADKFEDNFIKKLAESTFKKSIEDNEKQYKKYINKYITKNDLLKFIEYNKNDILFEMFYNYDIFNEKNFEKKQKSILRFIFSHFLSEMGNLWLEFFDPNYSVYDPLQKDFVNQLKALNYLVYNIKKENYPRAYSCFANINTNNNLIYKIKDNLEVMAKNQIFCDIIENHIDASQYYREQKKYNVHTL